MAQPSPGDAPASQPADELRYGGYTRFELELEFVQCLANPWYLNHLASQKLLDNSSFVAYLGYLQYFKEPKYAKYLTYVLGLFGIQAGQGGFADARSTIPQLSRPYSESLGTASTGKI
ncbi:MAG: hypothetical protein M1819_003890 [Sarea resinae]|nr:MAG: hypothetical protein M1819_003890 [Sarea resinae]